MFILFTYDVVPCCLHFFWILDHCLMWPIGVRFERRYCCSLYLVRKGLVLATICYFVLNMVFFQGLEIQYKPWVIFGQLRIEGLREVFEKICKSTFQLLIKIPK